ncbi:hypothetical protein BGZ60DRAFT_470956 [Tricladium varicosporioides]|nr:hypothetical protein BGZ60DRAFT_470956 [Hymenoscyphus varicosporioides]
MAALHDALKTLGPLDFSETPLDDLKPFLSQAFKAGQLIVDSVPIPVPAGDPISLDGRSHASSASSASEILPSSARSPAPEKDVEVLQKEWKGVKMNARDNPLGMNVYKLGGKDGKGAWFARRSVHEGLGFTKWKKGLEREFPETMKVQGGPGEGNIRGIGGEKRVAFKDVEGVGQMEVYLLSAQFPGPTTPRDFVTMFLTSDQALSDKHGEVPRHFMVISRPCYHPDTPARDGFIRGQYESVEFIREIPLKPRPKKSLSTTNLSGHGRKRSGSSMSRDAIIRNAKKSASESENGVVADEKGSASDADIPKEGGRARGHTISFDKSRGSEAKGEQMDLGKDEEECEDNPVEWIMITRSDPGGSVPRFMIERGTPGGIVSDASKFLDWACAKDLDDSESDAKSSVEDNSQDERANEKEHHQHHHKHNHEKDLHNWQTNGYLAGIEEQATPVEEKKSIIQENNLEINDRPTNIGLYGMVAGAAGIAGGYIASHAPQVIQYYVQTYTHDSPQEPAPTNNHVPPTKHRESVSTISSESSVGSFASALDHYGTNTSNHRENDATSTRSQQTTTSERTSHTIATQDKELAKLEDKKKRLDEKLARAREKELSKKSEDTAKEEEAIKRAEERHEREVKKQEERYKKEVEKLERKKEKELKKTEEKKKKAADKDERVRLLRELEELKAEVGVLRKEKDILRGQVGELQAENTTLAAKVGRLGLQGEEVLREVREENRHRTPYSLKFEKQN